MWRKVVRHPGEIPGLLEVKVKVRPSVMGRLAEPLAGDPRGPLSGEREQEMTTN